MTRKRVLDCIRRVRWGGGVHAGAAPHATMEGHCLGVVRGM